MPHSSTAAPLGRKRVPVERPKPGSAIGAQLVAPCQRLLRGQRVASTIGAYFLMNPQGMTMPTPLVRKRCFVQMTGYEPVGAEHYHRRFIREMARFLKAWSLQGKVSPGRLSSDGHVLNFDIDTWGPNWRVRTDFHYFRWADIVTSDMA